MKLSVRKELEWQSKHYDEIQKQTLLHILGRNSETEYGRKYNFREINSKEEFRKNVPLSQYGDYKEYISHMIKEGAENLILSDKVNYYAVSSGTAGEPKYFPVSELEILFFIKYAYLYSHENIESFLGGSVKLCSNMERRLFLLNEIRCTPLGAGIKRGIISGIPFDYLREKNRLWFRNLTSPSQVLFPKEGADMFYLRLRFALGYEDVEGILGTFVHQILYHMKYMEENWERLVDDIGMGIVSKKAGVSDKMRAELEKDLFPMPERADFLYREFSEGFDSPIVPRIWKDIKFTMGIGGEEFGKYEKKLRKYTGDLARHCFIFGSSEGFMGACPIMGRKAEYLLLPECGYYEFLTEEGSLVEEPGKGERYEIVFTGYSGLYRYKMKDVIEIVDFYNEIPVFKFAYRKDGFINIAGEKMELSKLKAAAEEFGRKYGIRTDEFFIYPSDDDGVGNYVFLMETEEGKITDKLAKEGGNAMDCELRKQSFDYDDCRSRGEISPAKVHFIKRGAFGDYAGMLRKRGVDTGQLKPVILLNMKEKREFFNDRIIL